MANARRGEVALTLGGQCFTLCLTFGALAELEAAFGASDIGGLAQRFSQGALSTADIVTLLAVALRGGGHPFGEDEVRALPLAGGLPDVVAALTALLRLTFLGAESGDG